jgi:hypothetical protein
MSEEWQVTSQVLTAFNLGSVSRHVSLWFQALGAEKQSFHLRLLKTRLPLRQSQIRAASVLVCLTHAPRLCERVEAEQDEQHGETCYQVEPHQS